MEECPKCKGLVISERGIYEGMVFVYLRCLICGLRIYGNSPHSKPKAMLQARCKRCGETISVRHYNQKYCNRCKAILQTERNRRKRVLICQACHGEFMAVNRYTKYCPDCRQKAYSAAGQKAKCLSSGSVKRSCKTWV